MKNKLLLLFIPLCSAFSGFCQTAKDLAIIGGFYQDKGDNCASVSVIKVAISYYGADLVCAKIDTMAGGYHILLQDGNSVDLTNAEIATIDGLDKFGKGQGAQTEYIWAKFYYAVMAKRKMNLLGLGDIAAAAVNGKYFELAEDTGQNIVYLGLENKLVKHDGLIGADQLPDIILTNPRHSAYCSHGSYDEKGNAVYYTQFVHNHSSFLTRLLGVRGLNQWYYGF